MEDAIRTAAEEKLRAVTVSVDKRRPRLVVDQKVEATESMHADLAKVSALLDDKTPSAMLVNISEENWALFCWYPTTAEMHQKVQFNSIVNSLKEKFPSNLRDFHVETRAEVTPESLLALASGSAAETKLESENRKKLEDYVQAVEEETKGLKYAASLAALKLDANSSLEQALGNVLTAGSGAVLATLKANFDGETKDELCGEVLAGVTAAPDMVGKLPKGRPCYVILVQKDAEGKRSLTLIVWEPEEVDARENVIISTMKAAVIEVLYPTVKGADLFLVEIQDEEALKKELIVRKAEAPAKPLPRASKLEPVGAEIHARRGAQSLRGSVNKAAKPGRKTAPAPATLATPAATKPSRATEKP